MSAPSAQRAQFIRRYRHDAALIPFTLNGELHHGRAGDTVLTAIMTIDGHVRQTEFSGENRAGFCLIGSCQDCVVLSGEGERIRACTTPLIAGMCFVTGSHALETLHCQREAGHE